MAAVTDLQNQLEEIERKLGEMSVGWERLAQRGLVPLSADQVATLRQTVLDPSASAGDRINAYRLLRRHRIMPDDLARAMIDLVNSSTDPRVQASALSSLDGVTWTPELLLAQGQSDASSPAAPLTQDYLEYCGTAAHNGCVYAAWTDFSNFTGDNPDGTSRSDVYVSCYMQR